MSSEVVRTVRGNEDWGVLEAVWGLCVLYLGRRKSSFKDLIFLFKTRVYKTQDPCGIKLPHQQVELVSLSLDIYMEIEPLKPKMLFCNFVSNACQLIILFPSLMLACKLLRCLSRNTDLVCTVQFDGTNHNWENLDEMTKAHCAKNFISTLASLWCNLFPGTLE